ncbi:unnamed protein product, partial [Penicillium bialowiezense]
SDSQGNREIAAFGVNRSEVPNYSRSGYGGVVGASGQRITLDSRNEDTLVLQNTSAPVRPNLLSSQNLQNLTASIPIRVRPNPSITLDSSTTLPDHLRDFISTEAPSLLDISEYENHLDDYRTIQTPLHPGQATVEDADSNKASMAAAEAEVLRRNADLLKMVERDPHDINSWLSLAEHQWLVIAGSRFDNRPLDLSEIRLVAKAKLSVYEKAIAVNLKNPDLDHLLIGRMEEGGKIWEPEKLRREWEKILTFHSEFISLWIKYLDHCQTDSASFTFQTCFMTYRDCLALANKVSFGRFKNQVRAYLFLRLTLFLRESGYTELAVGLWQAVLEFTCFRPTYLTDEREALEAFKKLWASANARVGERGWKAWNTGEANRRMDEDRHNSGLVAGLPDLFETWAIAERQRMDQSQLPNHAFVKGITWDPPFRAVIYLDAKQILPHFWDCTDNFYPLINAFLYFSHLPSLASHQNLRDTRLWSGDNFIRNEYMDDSQNTIEDWIKLQTSGETVAMEPFAFPHQNFHHVTDTLFADPKYWFSSLSQWAKNTSHETSVVDQHFTRRVVYALADQYQEQDLAEYAIALTFACDHSMGKRYGKHMLKLRSSDLRIYNAMALMQWRTENYDHATKVWSNALTLSQGFEVTESVASALIWNSWIWELLHAGQPGRVAYLLQAMPYGVVDMQYYNTAEEDRITPANFLRLKNFLVAAQQSAFAIPNPQAYAAYTDCYAIALWLMGESLTEIMKDYDKAFAALDHLQEDMKVFAGELLHQSRARFIYSWVKSKKGQFRPKDIHQHLLQSLKWWPHNTIFLSLFKWNDARFIFTDRTHDIFEVLGRDPSSPNSLTKVHRVPISTHLFSIYIEMGRPVVLGSTSHSIRAAFDRALADAGTPAGKIPPREHGFELTSSVSAQNNLTLWRLYFLFELYAEQNVTRARDVYLRAVNSCPWSKELYMLGFEHLRADLTAALPARQVTAKGLATPQGLDTSELRAMYTGMMRRGLRIHHPVDGFWARKRGDAPDDDDSDDDEEDEEAEEWNQGVRRRKTSHK